MPAGQNEEELVQVSLRLPKPMMDRMAELLKKIPGGKNLPLSAVIRAALEVALPQIDKDPALMDLAPAVRRGPKTKKK